VVRVYEQNMPAIIYSKGNAEAASIWGKPWELHDWSSYAAFGTAVSDAPIKWVGFH